MGELGTSFASSPGEWISASIMTLLVVSVHRSPLSLSYTSLHGEPLLIYIFVTIIFRSPDSSKIKQKMLYASSKDALRRSLQALAVEIQGTDFDEISYEAGT